MKCFSIRLIQLPLLSQNTFNFFWFRRKFSNIELCIKANENKIISLVWHLSLSRFRALKQRRNKNWLIISRDVKKSMESKLLKSSSILLDWKFFFLEILTKLSKDLELAERGRNEMTKDIQYIKGEVGGNTRKHFYCLETIVSCQCLT